MHTNPAIDEFGKVTVSLGAHCPLACAHCYTTAPVFHVDSKRAVDDALKVVASLPQAQIVCLSGDTDPFLRPSAAVEFLERAADAFEIPHLMFTTRLILPEEIEDRLRALQDRLAAQSRLCVGAISLVTPDYPNGIEDVARVPTPADRLRFLERLSAGPQPVLLALRPTLPFSVVSPEEVESMIETASASADVVLGEVLLLDQPGVIADRLGVPRALPDDEVGAMSFLNQPTAWRKRKLLEETVFAEEVCSRHGLPYFLRSITAMRYFERYWDLSRGETSYEAGDPLELAAETTSP